MNETKIFVYRYIKENILSQGRSYRSGRSGSCRTNVRARTCTL